jgi:hypothetical protein
VRAVHLDFPKAGDAMATDDDIQEQAVQHTVAANPLIGVRGDDISVSSVAL